MSRRWLLAAGGLTAAAVALAGHPAAAWDVEDGAAARRVDQGSAGTDYPRLRLQGRWDLDRIGERGGTKFTPSARFPGTSANDPQDAGSSTSTPR